MDKGRRIHEKYHNKAVEKKWIAHICDNIKES